MSDEPDVRWSFAESNSRRGRTWIVVLLIIVGLVIAGGVLWFLFGGTTPKTDATPSPAPSVTVTATPTATPSPLPSATPSPDASETTNPAPVDPDVEAFAGIVGPRITDASRGLSMVANLSGSDAIGVIDQLLLDAQHLAEAAAPNTIASDWNGAVNTYSAALTQLRADFEANRNHDTSLATANSALGDLKYLLGL